MYSAPMTTIIFATANEAFTYPCLIDQILADERMPARAMSLPRIQRECADPAKDILAISDWL